MNSSCFFITVEEVPCQESSLTSTLQLCSLKIAWKPELVFICSCLHVCSHPPFSIFANFHLMSGLTRKLKDMQKVTPQLRENISLSTVSGRCCPLKVVGATSLARKQKMSIVPLSLCFADTFFSFLLGEYTLFSLGKVQLH